MSQNLDFIPWILVVFGFYFLEFGMFEFYTLKFQKLRETLGGKIQVLKH